MNSQQSATVGEAIGVCFFIGFFIFIVVICSGAIRSEIRLNSLPFEEGKTSRIDNVVKVFTHHPNEYSILYAASNGQLVAKKFSQGSATLMMDCPSREAMYVTITELCKEGTHLQDKVVIHIHTPEELQGGSFEYRQGKHNHTGQTNVVE